MVCETCNQKAKMQDAKHKATQLGKGAMGLAKVALGIDQAAEELVQQRLNICKACDDLQRAVQGLSSDADISLRDYCRDCGCLIRAKVKLNKEICPKGKW